jgi:hypothetical protein
MKLHHNALRLLAGALSLASVAGLRASSNNDHLEVFRKLISSTNFDSAALKESLGSLNSKLVQKQFEKRHGRHLETGRECGKVFASVTLAEVRAFLDIFVTVVLADPAVAEFKVLAERVLFMNVQYGFKAVKVCMSCEEAMEVLSDEQLASSDPYSFSSYCSEDNYGYGAVSSDQISQLKLFLNYSRTILSRPSIFSLYIYSLYLQEHSALVFLPVDPETGEVFKASIRTLFSAHGTQIDVAGAPTEIWPSDMTEFLATKSTEEFILDTMDYLFAVGGAATGAIVVNPDYIGYGQSVDYNRTFLAVMPYAQSFAMSWLATQKYVANSTAGCSELENVATVSGYSEGGYAAIPGSFALQQLGVTIWGAYPGGAPYQPIEQYAAVLADFSDGPPADPDKLFALQVQVAYNGYANSNEFPFLANTGADQPLLADLFRIPGTPQNAIDWFATGATIGDDFLDMINADFNAIFEAARADGVTNPCTAYVTNTTDKLCQVFEEASLIPLLGTFEGGQVVGLWGVLLIVFFSFSFAVFPLLQNKWTSIPSCVTAPTMTFSRITTSPYLLAMKW